ncbi:MAG: RNA polymerase sigma factor [Gammaproteobacteria bacterium]|nr:RNA polymerase sigma factor [Gammaproteobacteria bacterium]
MALASVALREVPAEPRESEAQLIALARTGDHQAFTRLLEIHDRRVMGVIVRFTGNRFDRDDIYQEVFTACYVALPRFNGTCAFYTWLHRIALNQCISFIRSRKTFEPEEDVAVEDESWERKAQLQAITNAQKQLAGPQQIGFHLYYVEQWSIEDIAVLLECSLSAAKTHIHRAREKIRADEEVRKWNIEI